MKVVYQNDLKQVNNNLQIIYLKYFDSLLHIDTVSYHYRTELMYPTTQMWGSG